MMRHSLDFVPCKRWQQKVAADLKRVYRAATADEVQQRLDEFRKNGMRSTCTRSGRGIRKLSRLGVQVRDKLRFEPGDRILEQQLALLHALELQLIAVRVDGQAFDRGVEVAVLDPQLDQLLGNVGRFVAHNESLIPKRSACRSATGRYRHARV